MNYYRIIDKNLIAKKDTIPYIYIEGEGWVVDKEHILMDRLIGYDEFEHSIGNSDMLFRVEDITEQEAFRLIAGM